MAFRKYSALFMVLILMFALSACDKATEPTTTAVPTEPPITAEYLYAKLAENAAETPITGGEIESETDITMTFTSLGTSTTTSIGEVGTFSYSPQQGIWHAEFQEGTSVYGEMTIDETVHYKLKEDGKNVTYVYSKTNDVWNRHASGQTMDDFCAGTPTPDSLTLEESTQTVAGKAVYVLHAQFSGDALKDSVGDISELLETMDMEPDSIELDMSCVTAKVTYYIDADSLLLVQVESSMDGIGESMTELIVEYLLSTLEDSKEELGDEYASTVKAYKQLKITVPVNTSTYKNISYDPVTVPELPAEAREAAALQSYDPLQADGNYLLKEVGVSALVKVPEGWTTTRATHFGVELTSPDEDNRLAVFLLADSTEEDAQGILDSTAAVYKSNGIYSSHGLNNVVNGWQTATITIDRSAHNYMAWKELNEDLWILVQYINFTGGSMGNTLLPQLETIEITLN